MLKSRGEKVGRCQGLDYSEMGRLVDKVVPICGVVSSTVLSTKEGRFYEAVASALMPKASTLDAHVTG
jgi:hypothetical protein